ncbi:MAG: triose-phosphate isomerase [bacterium]|nr:triose-phosphate isomerase [bacterium]
MKLPTIIVNFKLHEKAVGDCALKLAKIHEKVAQDTGASIGIAVNALDLRRVVEVVSIPVFAQHLDPVSFGSHTGHILPELLKEIGAFGTLLNHAEHQISDDEIRRSIAIAREVGLYTIVCANTPQKGQEIKEYGPDLIAVEPPELIGGDISVSKAGPHIVEEAVKLVGENRLLVGAGVCDAEDVGIALKLGACGVLLASGVTKADDPEKVLRELVSGLN